jgi:outer membrane protein, multidrug efflux system
MARGATEMVRRPAVLSAVIASLGSLLVAACAPVGPNYRRPPVVVPAEYRFAQQTAQAESLADARWWQVFEDPALQALIREAIANNLDLRAAAARVDRARAQAGIAKSFLYPQIDASAAYTVQRNTSSSEEVLPGEVRQNPDSGDDALHGGLYDVPLSWEVDLFGKIRRGHEHAVAAMLATEQGRRGVLVTLVADVASNYFLLRQLDAQLAISRETLRVNNETVTYFQNRLDGGVSNRLEVDRIVANRAVTAAAIPGIERQIAVIENALSVLLGRAPGPLVRDPLAAGGPPPVPPGLPASLLERRPDVVQAEQLLVAANADVGVAKALFFPAFSLTGLVGVLTGDFLSLLGGSGPVWEAGSSLVQPVFHGGRLRRNLEAARASVNEAVAQYQGAALNGYREVANGLIAIQKLAEVRVQHEAGVAALQDAAILARSRYDTGLASYLEILTTDQQLFQDQLQLAETRGSELRARADLYRALGGGWQP